MIRREIKRRAITLEQKLRVIDEIESNPQESRANVAERLGIPVTTLKSIYVKKDEIRRYAAEVGPSGSQRRRSQNGMYSELEKVLFEWFREQRDSNIPVSGVQLKEKALEMAREMNIANDFKASSGWVDKFRKRHGIAGRGNAAEIASLDVETDRLWMDGRLPDLINNYRPCDIYNLGETGLCLDLPNKFSGAKDELDKEIMRRRRRRGRLTLLVGVNADGTDKLPLLVIGKDKDPRCFETVRTLPTEYASDPKAWITPTLFKNQLDVLDSRMRLEKRHILVFLDTSTAHPPDLQFTNIKLHFFPPNCSSRVQPIHLGILAALKIRYKKLQVQRALASLQQSDRKLSPQLGLLEENVFKHYKEIMRRRRRRGRLTLLVGVNADGTDKLPLLVIGKDKDARCLETAMHFVAAAWHDIPADSIAKCFRLAGMWASDSRVEPPTQADESSLYGQNLPLHVEMDIGEPPNDWHKISDRMDYADFICQNDHLDVCDQAPKVKLETLSDSGDSSGDEAIVDDPVNPIEGPPDTKRIPNFIEALRAYEVAVRYITSKAVPPKDIAVVAAFARVLYDANASEGHNMESPDSYQMPK